MENIRKFGIIGIGPRGGYALENYIIELTKRDSFAQIHIYLFEETGNFGNGQVYETSQTKTNWININERILELKRREEINFSGITLPAFPSYHEWRNKDFTKLDKTDADTYPPRATVGEYLEQRFQSFTQPLVEAGIVFLIEERVDKLAIDKQNKVILRTDSKTYDHIDEVLLTIGHQPTKVSKQLSEWEKFASDKDNITLFDYPYPISAFLNSKNLTTKSRIGVRGFGLAAIDVMRGIADKFGEFVSTDEKNKACRYETKHDINKMFVPFSLNGLPPVPKPLNAEIDEWFKPSAEQISKFEKIIGDRTTQRNAQSPRFLINAFAPIAAEVYLGLKKSRLEGKMFLQEIETTVKAWINNHEHEHLTITSTEQPVEEMMQNFVDMAIGEGVISLDYCIGQVWRYCQPSIYKQLSYNQCSEKVFAEIIKLDEGTKSYSYGPPVESIQQMIALVKADVMTLDMVENPDFELTENGWRFQIDDKSITADMMINSVLDSPKIKEVNSPIVESMLLKDFIEAVHDELGVATDENGYVISQNEEIKAPIALLGRLAKGTVIGVDAILECFGTRPQNWAVEAAQQHVDWLENEVVASVN